MRDFFLFLIAIALLIIANALCDISKTLSLSLSHPPPISTKGAPQ